MFTQAALELFPSGVLFERQRKRPAMAAVDESVFVAVKSRTVTGEGDEVRPGAVAGPRGRAGLEQGRI